MRLDVDLMLPEQFHAPLRVNTPEMKLVYAVFEDAVHILHKYASTRFETGKVTGGLKRCDVYNEARDWIETDDLTWPYSFRNCCDRLGIEPEAVRTALLGPAGTPEIRLRASYRGSSLTKCCLKESWRARLRRQTSARTS